MSALQGPGRLLRAARESAGISLRDVAAQMHLDERTMIALEKDAFDELPAPTFVRGYLRGYARLLGVPVGPVMEAYDREGFRPPDLVADIAEKPQANSGDFPVRITTYVVVVVLATLVVAWWRNQGFDEPVPNAPAPIAETAATPATPRPASPPADAAAAPRDAVRSEPSPQAPSRTVAAAAPPPAPSVRSTAAADTPPSATAAGTSGPPASAPPAPASAQGAAETAARRAEAAVSRAERVLERTRGEVGTASVAGTPSTQADAVARTEPATGAAPPAGVDPGARKPASPTTSPAPRAAAEAAVPAQAPSAPAPESAGTPGEGRLLLSFPQESWVEVYDRNEKRMFYNLVKPGRELDLRGEPPIRVLLGRARGVELRYNGEPIDLAPHTERGVARVTLGNQ